MKINKAIFWIGLVLICVNLLLLTRYILFKNPESSFIRLRNIGDMPRHREKGNWVLFASIKQICHSRDERFRMYNLGGNIVGFVPLGLLLPLVIFRRMRFVKTLLTVFGISLLFEITQLYTGLGVFDVDDLLLNTFGGILGYCLYLACVILSRRSQQTAAVYPGQ